MANPTVSVVVVSKGRGASLRRTLTGLTRLLYDAYEIVVVADAEGLATVRAMGLSEQIKTASFADPNISLARNIGVSIAAGEIIAFIDDDAVPEPTWLTHLTAPFADASVAAVGGFVLGRNGISFQWKARGVDYAARETDLPVSEAEPTILTPPVGHAIKTEGTNMAVRRADLAQIGGFDPAYRFYLDDTDLNMRLAKARQVSAIAPLAQVHHAFAPSARRGASRVPKDLFEIGASLSVFLRRHCPEAERAPVIAQFRKDRRASLIRHMVAGGLEPRDVRRLMARLDDGIRAGRDRPLRPLPALPHSSDPFLPFQTLVKPPCVVMSGRVFARRRLRKLAEKRSAAGELVSLFLFSPTTLFHRVRMSDTGVWEQSGGLFGKSTRSDWLVQPTLFSRRVTRETNRVAKVRGISPISR